MKDGDSTAEERDSFLQGMTEAAASVTLVTTDGTAGRFGVTVSAFASVSADPPMLLACINRRSPAAAAIVANGGLCVNVLSAAQRYLAEVFAGRSERFAPYDFGCADWERAEGGWRLRDSVASFACALDRDVMAGTHQILIGRVLDTQHAAPPCAGSLIYTRRAYSIAQPIL